MSEQTEFAAQMQAMRNVMDARREALRALAGHENVFDEAGLEAARKGLRTLVKHKPTDRAE